MPMWMNLTYMYTKVGLNRESWQHFNIK
jgi:hypothetical protein